MGDIDKHITITADVQADTSKFQSEIMNALKQPFTVKLEADEQALFKTIQKDVKKIKKSMKGMNVGDTETQFGKINSALETMQKNMSGNQKQSFKIEGIESTITQIKEATTAVQELRNLLTENLTGNLTSQVTALDTKLGNVSGHLREMRTLMDYASSANPAIQQQKIQATEGNIKNLEQRLNQAYSQLSNKTGIKATTPEEMLQALSAKTSNPKQTYLDYIKKAAKDSRITNAQLSETRMQRMQNAQDMLTQYLGLGGDIKNLGIKGLSTSPLLANVRQQSQLSQLSELRQERSQQEAILNTQREALKTAQQYTQQQQNTNSERTREQKITEQTASVINSIQRKTLDGTYQANSKDQQIRLERYADQNTQAVQNARNYAQEYQSILSNLSNHFNPDTSYKLENSQIVDMGNKLKTLSTQYRTTMQQIATSPEMKFQRVFGNLNNRYQSVQTSFDTLKSKYTQAGSSTLGQRGYERLTQQINAATEAQARFNAEASKGSNANLNTMNADLKEFNSLSNKAKREYSRLNSEITTDTQQNAINNATAWGRNNSKATSRNRSTWNSIMADLSRENMTTGQFEDARARLTSFQNQMRATGQTGRSWSDTLLHTFRSLARFSGVYTVASNMVVQLPRKMAESIKEVNAAQVELNKVSSATKVDLSTYYDEVADSAKKYGATISDVISSTADWSRTGYSLKDAKALSEATTLYQKVGDNMTQETASESLISTLQGFKLEASEAESIVDKFNEVGNNYAIGSDGIGEALQRSAASFNVAHTSLSKSIALITGTNEVLQDPSRVGNMWKTVSARLRGADQELTDMGETTEGMVTSTSKLRDLVKGITGFDIMQDAAGTQFKDIYDIVVGIGEKWNDLSDINRAGLLEALAGKNQSNALAAALNNIDTVKAAYQTAEFESAGSAQKELEAWNEGIEASLAHLQASFQSFSVSAVKSDFFKGIVDSGTTALDVVTNLINKTGVLAPLISGLMTKSGLGKRNADFYKIKLNYAILLT